MTGRVDTEALRSLLAKATPRPWLVVPHWGEDGRFEIEPMHKDGKLSETGHWASIATDVCDPFEEDEDTAEANAQLMAASKILAAEVLELRAKLESAEKLAAAARELVAHANGDFEGDDGERAYLIHGDFMFALEQDLDAFHALGLHERQHA